MHFVLPGRMATKNAAPPPAPVSEADGETAAKSTGSDMLASGNAVLEQIQALRAEAVTMSQQIVAMIESEGEDLEDAEALQALADQLASA